MSGTSSLRNISFAHIFAQTFNFQLIMPIIIISYPLYHSHSHLHLYSLVCDIIVT